MQDVRTNWARTWRRCRRKLQLGAGWPPLTQLLPGLLLSTEPEWQTRPPTGRDPHSSFTAEQAKHTQHRQRDKPQHVPHQETEVNLHTRHMEPQVTAGDKPEHTLSTS